MRYLLISFFLSLLLLTGALGLKFSIAECDSDPEIDRESERMNCYYTVAIGNAYVPGYYDPSSVCDTIWSTYGANRDDDTATKAELLTNNCHYDVAKIVARTSLLKAKENCESIYSRREQSGGQNFVDTGLFGEKMTQERCLNEVERIADIAPEHYYEPGKDNICSIIFILPVLLFAAIRYP